MSDEADQNPKASNTGGEPANERVKKERVEKMTQEERLESLRERLYSRGKNVPPRERRRLSPQKNEARESWGSLQRGMAQQPRNGKDGDASKSRIVRPETVSAHTTPPVSETTALSSRFAPMKKAIESVLPQKKSSSDEYDTEAQQEVSKIDLSMPAKKNRRTYIRTRLFGAAALFFAIAAVLSGVFYFFGQNTISGNNISIDIEGPFVLGGGEEIDLQIAVSNQNAVSIEAATLIIEYPEGTQSATEPGKDLFRERKSLEAINPGEVLNLPVKAVVFGEENEEKTISVSVEYRVRGSNATFFKEAEPLRFKISSSPVTISVNTFDQISSGQEVELTVTVASNSPTPLNDILVEAEYPFGFDFTESSIAPVSGQNVWSIDTLEPEGEQEFTVKGILVGDEAGERVFDFRVGVSNERDAFSLASVFSVARAELFIEEAFLGLDVRINSSGQETVAVEREEGVRGTVSLTNSLSSTIYDAEITVRMSGNALDEERVRPQRGFYDSNTNTITWTSADISELREIAPGETVEYSFNLEPIDDTVRTPQIELSLTASGKRVAEDRVPEALTDSVSRTIKFASLVDLFSAAVYSTGPFTNTGPVQPVAEEVTQYTFLFEVINGSNDITDAVMTATLPSYVTWLDLTSTDDDFTYNASTRELTWAIGDLDARSTTESAVQISVLPSQSQIGSIPTILSRQQLRATDRFTGTVVRDDASALSTRLPQDPDEDGHKGTVLAN